MITRNNNHDINNQILPNEETNKVKRPYSKDEDVTSPIETTKKSRKLSENKINNENNAEINGIDESSNKKGSEFRDFMKHFAIPSNIYKYLSEIHLSNPIMLRRCLSYRITKRFGLPKSGLQYITDHLSKIRFNDENNSLMKGKIQAQAKSNFPSKVLLSFDQFLDNQLLKDWQTVEANVYVDIVHFYSNSRKNVKGFCSNRIISNQKVFFNTTDISDIQSHEIDFQNIMSAVANRRVYKSVVHFKILAKEKKLYSKNISQDKKAEELYPVTYEAMMPFFNSRDDRIMTKDSFCLQTGKYEIYLNVTNMDKCDDSSFSGELANIDGKKIDGFSGNWSKVEDLQALNDISKATKLVFYIKNEESYKASPKTTKSRSKSVPPSKLLPNINGNYCLKSRTIDNKQKSEVNIAFKFMFSGKVVQWTKTDHLNCPWCQTNFKVFSTMFKTVSDMITHLNYMHPKFRFVCKKLANRELFEKSLKQKFVTVEVTLAEVEQADWDLGLVLRGTYPSRRAPLSEVIHTKYKQVAVPDFHRPNHRRDYCHTWSSRKCKYLEFDIDSEAEENMAWLYDHYERKVEEFSDLNHIEKRVIQLWNESLLRYGYCVGDLQMRTFIDRFVREIVDCEQKLRQVKMVRNTLLLHLVNLVDFGLLPPAGLLKCMKRLDQALDRLDGR